MMPQEFLHLFWKVDAHGLFSQSNEQHQLIHLPHLQLATYNLVDYHISHMAKSHPSMISISKAMQDKEMIS